MEAWAWMRSVLEVLLVVVGVPGNILIIAVYGSKHKKKTTHIFIIGLAIADFVECLSRPFTLAVFVRKSLKNNNLAICKLEYFLPFLSIFISVLFTTAIAIDRYFAICKPHSHFMTIQRAQFTVVLCIVLSVLLASPPVFIFGLKSYPVIGTVCTIISHMYV